MSAPSPPPGPPSPADYAILALLCAIWGSSFLFVKIAVAGFPALPMTVIRIVISALFLWALAVAWRQPVWYGRAMVIPIVASAVTGNVLPFFLIGWGEERIDSNLAAILMAPNPLMTVILAHYFTRDDRMTSGKVAGVALGVLGLVVLVGPAALARLGDDIVRQLAVVAAGGCYAVNSVVTKRYLMTSTPLGMVASVMIASMLILLPFGILTPDWAHSTPTFSSIGAAITLGLLNSALGTLVFFELIRRQGASFYSQINYFVPLFGVVYGWMVLAEVPSANALLALVIILAGVWAARRG